MVQSMKILSRAYMLQDNKIGNFHKMKIKNSENLVMLSIVKKFLQIYHGFLIYLLW